MAYTQTVDRLASILRIPRRRARRLYNETRDFRKAVHLYREEVGHKLPRGRMSAHSIDEVLRSGAAQRLVVVLDYVLDSETRVYKVAPYSYRDQGRKFFGYDVLDRCIKAFDTARIVRAEITPERFRAKWEVEL